MIGFPFGVTKTSQVPGHLKKRSLNCGQNDVNCCTVYFIMSVITFEYKCAVFVPSECCFHFYVDRLPKNKVDDYRLTSPHCPNKVRMQNGKEFCVNPDQRWVKGITNFIDQKKWLNFAEVTPSPKLHWLCQ
uniref:Chemokine interleukin-8-like domain-containing protein n=1 Tax=Neogobius melanostomus TaxID=47308 RepID=A0A8C6SG82_9GOBI